MFQMLQMLYLQPFELPLGEWRGCEPGFDIGHDARRHRLLWLEKSLPNPGYQMRLGVDAGAAIYNVALNFYERVTTRLKYARGIIMHSILRNSTQIYQEDVRIRTVSGKDFRIIQNDEEVVSIGP